jgi:hypothetical protein
VVAAHTGQMGDRARSGGCCTDWPRSSRLWGQPYLIWPRWDVWMDGCVAHLCRNRQAAPAHRASWSWASALRWTTGKGRVAAAESSSQGMFGLIKPVYERGQSL